MRYISLVFILWIFAVVSMYFSKEKLPDAKQKGTSFGPGMGKGYLYSFEGEGFRQDKLKVKAVDKSVKRIATLFPVQ